MTRELVEKFKEKNIEDIPDFMNMEDEDRNSILQLPEDKVVEMAEFCNRYPSINLAFEV